VYLSGDEAACEVVREGRPEVLVLGHPLDATGLVEFLRHTWALDPPLVATPAGSWWDGAA
jgi:hypothetical protein